jgi:pyruvate/2-oxoglutarate dehydrogenase complex dihydrolipoamide acyltransferase (E2) component
MEPFIIDVPVPSMGATVSELNVILIRVQVGDRVTKGQRIADLESGAKPGETLVSGRVFCSIETTDESQKHLIRTGAAPAAAAPAAKPAAALVWTPRATKLAQEAGLDPAKLTDIAATGPGGRVSGDDVAAYLASRKS